MCGLAGYVNLDGRPLVAKRDGPVLAAMGAAIAHRGPDDTRSLLWQNVGFIFKRLSIVDVEGGVQPLHAGDGRVSAMVNGAIYNHRDIRRDLAQRHRLTTGSDCEVLPFLYLDRDVDLFAPVNGMFAMALLDRQKRRVLLARDRVGIKPLFYCIADHGRVLVFASELKGLFAHPAVPRVFDWNAALGPSAALIGEATQCPSGFCGIERVPAASLVDIALDGGRVDVRRYWTLPEGGPETDGRTVSQCVDGYRALLADSVERQLMSDVGYGLFLSGGVDSSAVAALAARAGPFPTFSIRSASTIGSGDALAAEEVAASLALPNHQLWFDETADTFDADAWRRVVWACELHTLTAEQLFKFNLHAFAKTRYPGLKVMLLGQGSDEFNGGYLSHVLQHDGPWRADDWATLGAHLRGNAAAQAAADAGVHASFLDLYAGGALARARVWDDVPRTKTTVWRRYVAHFRRNLDYHLWHEDRTAAWHGIESRVPFLDHRLIEYVAQVPHALHAQLFTDKAILRAAAAPLLARQHAARPKGYLFYGDAQASALRMMYNILRRNGGELVEQAIAGSARTGGPLAADGFRAYADAVGRDPQAADVPRLLWLVNMGVLADMADHAPPAAAGGAALAGFGDGEIGVPRDAPAIAGS